MTTITIPSFTLNTGAQMSILGLGVLQMYDADISPGALDAVRYPFTMGRTSQVMGSPGR